MLPGKTETNVDGLTTIGEDLVGELSPFMSVNRYLRNSCFP